jgi:hypothetical protein
MINVDIKVKCDKYLRMEGVCYKTEGTDVRLDSVSFYFLECMRR